MKTIRHLLRKLFLWSSLAVLLLACVAIPLAIAFPQVTWALWYWDEPAAYTVPVSHVKASSLVSTWGAPRPGGRKHRGTDIFAPKGTPVVSATDGVVLRVGTNKLGGNVVWVVGEGRSVYYYAHLDAWVPGLRRGAQVRAGEVLGYVGNTGNAARTPAHLHFSVHRLSLSGLLGVDPVPVLAGARTVKVAKPAS